MYRLPSTSSIRAPDALRMNSGDAPTLLNARTGLSTPPGRICWARLNRRDERLVIMLIGVGLKAEGSALSPDRLPDFNSREIADRGGQEFLLVLIVRARAGGIE